MSDRGHTRADSGICTYRCGGLSVAEVRTPVVLGSRTVLVCDGRNRWTPMGESASIRRWHIMLITRDRSSGA